MTSMMLPGRSKVFILLFVSLALPGTARAQAETAVVPARLTLSAAIQLLIKQSPIVLRNQQNVKIAAANVLQAGLRPNPTLEINSESYPLFERAPGSFLNNQELTVRTGQTLETAGKRGKRVELARQELGVSEYEVRNSLRQVKLELKRRYYTVVLAKAQRELADEILKQFDEIIRLNTERFKQGEISWLEMSRIRAERFRFFSDQLEADLQLRNAKTALLELLGVTDFDAPFEVTETLTPRPPQMEIRELQAQAAQVRPDLLAATQTLERNRVDLRLQKAQAVPDITSFAGYRRDFGLNALEFGVNVPLPLFHRNQGEIGRATAQITQQEHEVTRVLLNVRREVQDAYQALEIQKEKVRAMEQEYVPSARRARDIAQQSYRLGTLDLIGLLDSERVYRETVRAYNVALFDCNAAMFQVEAAVGKEF